MKRCNFICEECKAPYKEKHFFKDCFPCCSLSCFEQYTHRISQKALREAGLTQKAKELELERFREIAGIQCQDCKSVVCMCGAINAGLEAKSQTKTPSLKDFIGKECSVFGLGKGSFAWDNGDSFVNNINGSIITHHYNYVYMGSDDTCHIIQRKVDGEPDGIFFFPKAAVALRF